MDILIQAGQLLLSLSILVLLHELGHFIPAKLFKTKVEKFYLFFDPWFSLFKVKKGETEYGIGWLPLGGYVKIAGMIDESMDKEQLKQEPQPWEFRSKPAWQRLIIMAGGVTVNVILGIFIYALIAFIWGDRYLPIQNAKYGITCDSLALQVGFKNGDKIKKVDNFPLVTLADVKRAIILDNGRNITLDRNGKDTVIRLPENIEERIMQMESKLFVERFPFVVRALDTTNLNAKKAGILKGDRILTINNDSAAYFHEFVMNINKHKDKTVEIGLLRAGEYKTLRVPVSSEGTVGLAPELPDHFLKFDTIHYGFFESFVKGTEDGVETIDNYIKQFKLVFTKEGAKHIGGFASIGGLFPKQWDLQAFLGLTAFLSMVLAFMNILPIPALDGGHIMFLLYEVIFRRKPSEKFMEYAQYVGMALLLSLLLFANGNDAYKGISQLFK